MKHTSIKFIKILPNQSQVELLYKLLEERKYNISHCLMPTYEEHKQFVKNHPYRAWYLLTKNDSVMGSFYLTNENSIGINIESQFNSKDIKDLINFIKDTYSPLPIVKSVRRQEFFINVSPQNTKLLNCLKRLNKSELQTSFLI
tara:strand:+ start:796 stop:1227 length:432 start_codon:yes stop_codon:yes gene_type:complete